ncbi:MAG: aminoacyl-tRNA hydrolase [Candidatus Gracilibacteria bacterium]|nr:aminoacyl-tRNA hydrolase [Candidatus Gracilibacteria bacterium]MDD3120759.1 aminoacyl-tRNA hydrolase [Candidatus Gracilibacteria bacterium]MDD4530641.1 aminoacyl-tRNA hydrolase [Candidatus Gracilibacteria bacterium]
MFLIVGLGNPGNEYRQTRHNVGFLFLDYLREKLEFEDFKDSKFKGLISEGTFAGEKTVLLKPLTYMNLSGESVATLMNFYKIPLENFVVIYDDMDLEEFGKIRFRDKGQSGGHNGIKSITKCLGTEEFKRIKIGIGKKQFDAADRVLSKFSKEELENLIINVFPEAFKVLEENLTRT